MKITDVLQNLKETIKVVGYGAGLYVLTYPAYYNDGTPVTIAIKIENETEVVLERGEEAENMGLLSTSDEYTILDMGSVMEKFVSVEGVEDIIEKVCAKYHIQYTKGIISLEADIDTTLTKINRFVKCVFEIESHMEDKIGTAIQKDKPKTNGVSQEFMAYLKRSN